MLRGYARQPSKLRNKKRRKGPGALSYSVWFTPQTNVFLGQDGTASETFALRPCDTCTAWAPITSPRHRFPLPGAEMITFSAPASMWPTAFLGKRLNKRHFCSQEESSSQRLVLNEEPCGLDNVLDAHVLPKDQWRRNLKTPHLKWLLPRQGFRALTAGLDAPRSCTTKAAQTGAAYPRQASLLQYAAVLSLK